MERKHKSKYVIELRDIYDSLDQDRLLKDPDNLTEVQKINRTIAIFQNFSNDIGHDLEDKLNEFQRWCRTGKRQKHSTFLLKDLLRFIHQKIEEMDVYEISDAKQSEVKKREDLVPGEPPQTLKNLKWLFWESREKLGWFGMIFLIIGLVIVALGVKLWSNAHPFDKPGFSYAPLSSAYQSRDVKYPTWIDFWFDGNIKNTSHEEKTLERIGWVIWKNKNLGSVYDYGYFSIDGSVVEFGDNDQRTPISLPISFEPNEAKHLGLTFYREVSDQNLWSVYTTKQCQGVFCWNKNEANLLFEDANGNVFDEGGRLISNDVMDTRFLMPNNRTVVSSSMAWIKLAGETAWWKIRRTLHIVF